MDTNPGCPQLVWESNKHHLNKRKMKKLNLEKLNLAAEDVLQRNQLSGIYGGSGGSSNCENSYCDANIVCCEPFFYLCSGPIGTCKRR